MGPANSPARPGIGPIALVLLVAAWASAPARAARWEEFFTSVTCSSSSWAQSSSPVNVSLAGDFGVEARFAITRHVPEADPNKRMYIVDLRSAGAPSSCGFILDDVAGSPTSGNFGHDLNTYRAAFFCSAEDLVLTYTASFSLLRWYTLSATRLGTTWRLYLDGQQAASTTSPATAYAAPNQPATLCTYFGNQASGGDYHLWGHVDRVVVSDSPAADMFRVRRSIERLTGRVFDAVTWVQSTSSMFAVYSPPALWQIRFRFRRHSSFGRTYLTDPRNSANGEGPGILVLDQLSCTNATHCTYRLNSADAFSSSQYWELANLAPAALLATDRDYVVSMTRSGNQVTTYLDGVQQGGVISVSGTGGYSGSTPVFLRRGITVGNFGPWGLEGEYHFHGAVEYVMSSPSLADVNKSPPTLTVVSPSYRGVAKGSSLAFRGATVVDADGDVQTLAASCGVAGCALSLGVSAGLAFSDAAGDSAFVATCLPAACQAALNSMTYTPPAAYSGADSLRLSVTDTSLASTSAVTVTVRVIDTAPTTAPSCAAVLAASGGTAATGPHYVLLPTAGLIRVHCHMAAEPRSGLAGWTRVFRQRVGSDLSAANYGYFTAEDLPVLGVDSYSAEDHGNFR